MQELLTAIAVLVGSYLLGSIPSGLIIVRLKTGEDIRTRESGRTGGTNVGRVAGFWAGLLTAFLDGLKGTIAALAAAAILPQNAWVIALAPVAAVIGHNYSIYLAERTPQGGFRLRGGAGGATTVGGAVGLWWPSLFIIIPVGALVLFGIGYASLATLTVGVTSIVIFAIRAWLGLSPWIYVIYGVLVEIILVWALRPNIQRLMNGTERLVGWRARRMQQSNPEQE
jgi:glycerol-3-phosphate acyltransferase PlsY